MNKKILILSTSPRKAGNSDLLCDEFAKGAREAGHSTEKINYIDKNINYCTGCGTCFIEKKGCTQKDDMTEVLDKMIAADVIVMATPIYFYTMCGQMKTLIDRTCARYSELKNKDFYFIMTAAVNNKKALDRTVEEFRGFTSCLDKPQEKGIIYGTGAWHIGDVSKTESFKTAFEMGKNV